MTQSESIVIAENIVDGGDNFCKLLKESKKNGTLEKYLQNKDINRLAFVAAEQDDKDCLKILIDRGVNLSVAVKDNDTVLDAIFDKVSDPEKFFNEVLDSKVNLDESSSRRNKVYILDFRLLRPEEDKQMAVISNLCEATSDKTMIKILQHPLFEIYLQLKWSKVVYLFYFWIFLHIISVLCMSAYVTLLTHDIRYHDAALTVISYVMFVIAPTLFLFGVVQTVLINPVRLCKYETWMNLITTILVLVVLGMELCSGYGARLQTGMSSWVLHVASVAILFLWIELMMLIGRLPKYGYYAVMFGVVLKNIVKVLLAFMCLVIGFALSFSIQFYHHHDFTDPWKALVKTVAMMIGEFDYGTIFDISNNSTTVTVQGGSPTSRVIFLLFVILTSIVLMNLMIGLAVNDIQKLEQEGHARKLQKQAEFLTQIEQIINKMNGKFLSPLATKVVKRFDIGEMVKLDASVKFLKTKKFSSRVRDFRLLRPEENKQMAVISNLCEATSDKTMINILQHPLLEIYLKNRWRANNLVYNLTAILHLISLAYAIITLTDAAINITEDSVVVEHIIIYISTPIFFVCRVILFWLICPPRLNKYETWMNLMATIFLLATGIIIIPSYDSATLKSKPTCVKVAFTLAFSGLATEMTISIGRINPYGYYITMYGVVLKKIVKLLLLYIYIFSYFAITSFSIIQYGRKNNDTSIYQNLVNIFTMLVGQFDYSKIVDTELATDVRVFKVISVIFVVLNSIVLMNLVIGLAVEDIHTLRQETHARMLQKQAEFLSRIEQITFFRKFDFLKPFQINETVRVGRSIKTMKHSSRLENALLKIVKKKKKKMNNLQSHDWNHGGSINRREHSLYRQCFRCGTSRPLARTTL